MGISTDTPNSILVAFLQQIALKLIRKYFDTFY